MDFETLQVRKQLEIRLIARAFEDPAFHQRLLADPRGAFEEEMGIPFPAALTLQFVQEAPNAVVVQLPSKPAADGELSDAQLDAVAAAGLWQDIKDYFTKSRPLPHSERVAVAGVRG
jgi:hypothetical protein